MHVNPSVVLAAERCQIGGVRPVITDVPQYGTGGGHTLTVSLLAQTFVEIVTHVYERPFLLLALVGTRFLRPVAPQLRGVLLLQG
jgi:hypothetical protein